MIADGNGDAVALLAALIRDQRQAADLSFRLCRGRGHAHDPGVAAAIVEKLRDGVSERALGRQSAEPAIELGEALHADRLVGRPARRAADEGGDRGRHARYGAHATRELFDIDTGVGQGCWHRWSFRWRR